MRAKVRNRQTRDVHGPGLDPTAFGEGPGTLVMGFWTQFWLSVRDPPTQPLHLFFINRVCNSSASLSEVCKENGAEGSSARKNIV